MVEGATTCSATDTTSCRVPRKLCREKEHGELIDKFWADRNPDFSEEAVEIQKNSPETLWKRYISQSVRETSTIRTLSAKVRQ